MKFYELAVGAPFRVHGQSFKKSAMAVGVDERNSAQVFIGIMEVAPEGESLLLSPEEAARWKPDYGPWTELLESMCPGGQRSASHAD